MKATYAHTRPGLVFPPQVPFSWTLRWARKHRDARKKWPRGYRIVGSVQSDEEFAAVAAFCDARSARLEVG